MCSGCSGNYEDDAENLEGLAPETGDDSDSRAGRWSAAGGPVGGHERRSADSAGSTIPTGKRDSSGGRDCCTVDEYEVLVSAERIVEIRMIAANCLANNPLAAKAEAVAWSGSRLGHKHFRTATAKFYRTQVDFETGRRFDSICTRSQLICLGFVAAACFTLAVWLVLG